MNFPDVTELLFRRVLEASAFGAALAVVVGLLQGVARNRLSAAWRHALLLPVLLRLLLPVFPESAWSLFNVPRWWHAAGTHSDRVTVAPMDARSLRFTAQPAARSESNGAANLSARSGLTPFQIAATGYWIVAAALLGRLALAALWLRLRCGTNPPSAMLVELLARVRAQSGTVWNPRLIETHCAASPGLFGCFRPRLLLPAGFARALSEAEMRHVLLHELAHLKRGDLWVNAAANLAQALHWFNPVVWLLARRIRIERELACDALVLRAAGPGESRAYGETILKLIERVAPQPALPGIVGILEEKLSAQSRLRQIANFSGSVKSSRKLGLALFAAVIVTGLSNAQSNETGAPVSAELISASQSRGLDALKRAYEQQQIRVAKLRKDAQESLNAAAAREIDEPETVRMLERERIAAVQQAAHDSSVVEMLKPLSRAQLRQILPGIASDAHLAKYTDDLAKTEQQYAALRLEYTDDHPEIKRLEVIQKTINRQIEERIGGVIKGLEWKAQQSKALAEETTRKAEMAKEEYSKIRSRLTAYAAKESALLEQERILETMRMRLAAETVDTNPARAPVKRSTAAASKPNPPPPQVAIETRFISVRDPVAADVQMLLRFIATNSTGALPDRTILEPRGLKAEAAVQLQLKARGNAVGDAAAGRLTEDQFQQVLKILEDRTGTDVLTAPKLTTLSGRAARVSIDEQPKIDLLAEVRPDGFAIDLSSEFNSGAVVNSGLPAADFKAAGTIWDGQTFVYWPEAGPARDRYIVFITARIINPSGKKVHTPADFKDKPAFPPQNAERR